MKSSIFKLASTLILSCYGIMHSQSEQPNILLILADDLAYTDISAYGGEIQTPNIDKLAENGIKFSQFHTAPYCAVARAMVLTGNNNHIAGMGSQDLKSNTTGYEGHLSDRVITIPQVLKEKGYHTFIAGKWHLGTSVSANPQNKGFNKSFVMLEGAANHYNNVGVLREPAISPYTEDGDPTNWPDNAYSTDLYTDKLIEYINESKSKNQPFFGFAAYTSPHWPLQVHDHHWKKFENHYVGGYDSLRIERFKRAKAAGLIPDSAQMPERHPDVRSWDKLSASEKKIEVRKMALYAGMVDNLDYNIGRIIAKLKELGIYENTLIIFMSDNGAAAEDFVNHSYFGPYIKELFNNDFENMGKPNSYISYGKQWAEAGSAPFKYFKGYTSQGGMTAPLIISGPQIENGGRLDKQFITVLDLAPTIYAITDSDYPKTYNNKEIKPLKGASLTPIFSNESVTLHDENYVFALEHRGYAMLRKDRWKLLNIELPYNTANFKLFDLYNDPGEQNDVSKDFPDIYKELLEDWNQFYEEVGIVIPTPAATQH